MKKLLLILSITLTGFGAMAQRTTGCGFIIPPSSLRTNFASTYEAKGYINNMLDKVNWQQNFQVREQNGINNAYATIIRNQRYIVYDNRFLENIDAYAATKWASISVLAHEVGHHYHDHLVSGGSGSISKELEADFFSGYVMAKLGADLEEAKAAMSSIASPRASSTHPGKNDRLDAITRGYNSALGGSISELPKNPMPVPQPQPQPQRQPTVDKNDPDWIHLSLYGNTDMAVYLSDDGRQFQQAPVKTSQPFVFKFDVYDYGWMRFGNGRNAKTYRLYHGRDYAIVWNRRTQNWTVVEVS